MIIPQCHGCNFNLTLNFYPSRLADTGESADVIASANIYASADRQSGPDLVVYGGVVVIILLVLSILLFHLDKWATERYEQLMAYSFVP